jgi:hypothetical protein
VLVSTLAQPDPFTRGKFVCTRSIPSAASGNRCSRSISRPPPTVCSRSAIDRRSSCCQAPTRCRFRAATSTAGTGTQWLPRKYPASPSIQPFSCGSAGVQNRFNRECERNAAKRAVPPRRDPRRIFLTAEGRLPYRSLRNTPPKYKKAQFVRFQKRPLGGMQIGAMECCSTGHAAHRKYLQP